MFRCPSCGGDTAVKDSRPSPGIGRFVDMHNVKRRRRCQSCGLTFGTREVYDDYAPVHERRA